jgi:hypothetical protein
MMMPQSPKPHLSTRRAAAKDPWEAGLPDPRPVTGYTLTVQDFGPTTRVVVALDQPCVIRTPNWAFIVNATGARVYPSGVVVVDPQTFYFEFAGGLPPGVGFVEAPYQDPQVQNFRGGFVRPGGQWFRAAA